MNIISRRDPCRRSRRGPVALTLLVTLLPAAVGRADDEAEAGDGRRPNVVFILADDLGWTDLACFGSGYYRTPNIDRHGRAGDAVHRRLHLRPELPADPGRPDERPVRAADRHLHRRRPRPLRLAAPAAGAARERHEARPDGRHRRRGDEGGRLRHRDVRQVAPRRRPRAPPARPGLRRGDRQHGPALRLQDQPEGRRARGHLPRRLPDRPGRRLHRPRTRTGRSSSTCPTSASTARTRPRRT